MVAGFQVQVDPDLPHRDRPFGARGMSSVRYGIRLGDLKNKQPNTHSDFWQ
jgi:hypothetical protein